MHTRERSRNLWSIINAPERNKYFHGMLMEAFHFERETRCLNAKRYLLNRLVSGYGVVGGLDVEPGEEPYQIWITPGVAIDRGGREIIVPQRSGPYTIPDDIVADAIRQEVSESYLHRHRSCRQEDIGCVSVLLGYRECEADPAPALVGDCSGYDLCKPSTIREQFEIRFEVGCVEPKEYDCQLDNVIKSDGHINYAELVRWVTERDCFELPDDLSIPLANVVVEQEKNDSCLQDYIHIETRPLCYVNDLLFELVLSLMSERQKERPRK